MNWLLVNNFYPTSSRRKRRNYCIRFGHSLWSAISCQRWWLTLNSESGITWDSGYFNVSGVNGNSCQVVRRLWSQTIIARLQSLSSLIQVVPKFFTATRFIKFTLRLICFVTRRSSRTVPLAARRNRKLVNHASLWTKLDQARCASSNFQSVLRSLLSKINVRTSVYNERCNSFLHHWPMILATLTEIDTLFYSRVWAVLFFVFFFSFFCKSDDGFSSWSASRPPSRKLLNDDRIAHGYGSHFCAAQRPTL